MPQFGEYTQTTSLNPSDTELVLQGGIVKQVSKAVSGTPIVSIAALKAVDVTKVANGVTVYVADFSTAGDGGGGSFVYSSASTALDNGGTIVQPTAGTGRWLRDYAGPINVKWFGVKGDGVTNDAVKFQAAISAAILLEKDAYVPSSRYILLDSISINGRLRIFGDGGASRLSFTAEDGIGVSSDNVTIENLRIDGAMSRAIICTKSNGNNLAIRSVDISGATVEPASLDVACIYIDDYNNVTIEDCYLHNFGSATTPKGAGVTVGNGSNSVHSNIRVTNCVIDGNEVAAFGVKMFNVRDSIVENCLIENIDIDDITSSGYGISYYNNLGAPSGLIGNVAIGNRIKNTQGTGIYYNECPFGIIANNYLEDTVQSQVNPSLAIGAIATSLAEGTSVTGNTIQTVSGPSGWGITVNSSLPGGSVIGNTIAGCSQAGIFLTASSLIAVVGNAISDCDEQGIFSPSTIADSTIADNIVTNCTLRGLDFSSISRSTITGNRIRDTLGGGMILTAGSNNVVTGNFCIRSSGTTGTGIDIRSTTTQATGNVCIGWDAGFQFQGANIDSTGNKAFSCTRTTDIASGGVVGTISTLTATPSVNGVDTWLLAQGSAQAINDLTGNNVGVTVKLVATNSNTTINHTSAIRLNGAANFAMDADDTLSLLRVSLTKWVEVGRSAL